MTDHYRFDHDAYQEAMYNPDREDTSRYDQARDEHEEARGHQRVNIVSTGHILTSDEREKLDR